MSLEICENNENGLILSEIGFFFYHELSIDHSGPWLSFENK